MRIILNEIKAFLKCFHINKNFCKGEAYILYGIRTYIHIWVRNTVCNIKEFLLKMNMNMK